MSFNINDLYRLIGPAEITHAIVEKADAVLAALNGAGLKVKSNETLINVSRYQGRGRGRDHTDLYLCIGRRSWFGYRPGTAIVGSDVGGGGMFHAYANSTWEDLMHGSVGGGRHAFVRWLANNHGINVPESDKQHARFVLNTYEAREVMLSSYKAYQS